MADFEEASVAGFQHVYPNAGIVGCWFHYAQAIIKCTNKIGLREAYGSDADVQNVVQCLMSLPLLPPEEIMSAIADVEANVVVDSSHENQLRQLIRYVNRQWINKLSVSPECLGVHDNQSHTNNVLESYHAALRCRIKVSHPNLYSFLSHLQQLTADQLNNVARLRNGLNIRRLKKSNMLNDKRIKSCVARFDSGVYSRLQFLRAVSHSVGAHTARAYSCGTTTAAAAARTKTKTAGARTSSDNFNDVRFDNGGRGYSVRRLL